MVKKKLSVFDNVKYMFQTQLMTANAGEDVS